MTKPIRSGRQVGPAGVERALDRHLADEHEVVVRRLGPVDCAQPLDLVATPFGVGHGHCHTVTQQRPQLAVGRGGRHRRAVACQLVGGCGNGLGRQRRVQLHEGGGQALWQHGTACIGPAQRAV